MAIEGNIVTVTKKGQATIPKKLRDKYGIKRKALVVGTTEGVLIRSVPDPSEERGSLERLFRGRTARKIIEEAREQDVEREKRHLKRYSR